MDIELFNYSFIWMWYLMDLVLIKFKCDSTSWDPLEMQPVMYAFG